MIIQRIRKAFGMNSTASVGSAVVAGAAGLAAIVTAMPSAAYADSNNQEHLQPLQLDERMAGYVHDFEDGLKEVGAVIDSINDGTYQVPTVERQKILEQFGDEMRNNKRGYDCQTLDILTQEAAAIVVAEGRKLEGRGKAYMGVIGYATSTPHTAQSAKILGQRIGHATQDLGMAWCGYSDALADLNRVMVMSEVTCNNKSIGYKK